MRRTNSVFFSVWTYYPYIGTLDSPEHSWKVRNFIYTFSLNQSSSQGMTGNVIFL